MPPVAAVRIKVDTAEGLQDPGRGRSRRRGRAPRSSGTDPGGPRSWSSRGGRRPGSLGGRGRSEAGEVGDLGIGDRDRVDQPVGQDALGPSRGRRRRSGAPLSLPGEDVLRRGLDPVEEVDRLHGHSKIPAMQAERKFARVPASSARKPRRARSLPALGGEGPDPAELDADRAEVREPAEGIGRDRERSGVEHSILPSSP